MANYSVADMLHHLATEAGLRPARHCFVDYRFMLALFAGMLVVWIGHDWLPPFSNQYDFDWRWLLALVLWQPVFEEILFRGVIQGQLARHKWGKRSCMQISSANAVTSLLFAGMHMINNPPLFSVSVVIPSLVFGYFRDRCNSIYPSMLLHGAYNAFVFAGLIIAGNMELPSS